KAAQSKPAVAAATTPPSAAAPPAAPIASTAAASGAAAPGPVVLAAPPPSSPSLGFTIGTPVGEPWPIGPVTPPRIAGGTASAGSFNPAIGVVLQGFAGAFSQNPNTYFIKGFALGDDTSPGSRGLSLGESEVNFQANVDPYLFGNLT